jgi:folate-binding protein YgfZ
VRRDIVLARGPDATEYLQGQLSQDLAALAIGDSAFSLLLQPQGKIDAWLRVTRLADDEWALDVEPGWGERVHARVKRFLLRVKVELERDDWSLAVHHGDDVPVPGGALRVASEVAGTSTFLRAEGGMADDEYERMRIEAGVPRMGRELDESTIPATAGIVDRSVSFTKGCYTGQELVARIDARGDRVPTKLRRIVGDVQPGDVLVVDGREIGHVTSAVPGAALAYVRREIEPPADAVVGAATVRIEA